MFSSISIVQSFRACCLTTSTFTLANVRIAFTSFLSFAACSCGRVALIIRNFQHQARQLKHLCEVVVHFFPVSYEEHGNLVLVCVYFVDGSVVFCSYAPEVRGAQRFPNFPRGTGTSQNCYAASKGTSFSGCFRASSLLFSSMS